MTTKQIITTLVMLVLTWLVVSWWFMWGPVCWETRNKRPRNDCINNLRIIDAGKEQWAMVNGKTNGTPIVTNEVNQYVKGLTTPMCPEGGSYIYNPVGNFPECTLNGQRIESDRIRLTFFTWDWRNGVKPRRHNVGE